MLRKLIKYTDYNGATREEEFYFNLSKTEVLEMEMTTKGGLEYAIKKMIQTDDRAGLIVLFKDLILKSYGEKSPDGRKFIKSPELALDFAQTEAYVELYMELVSNTEAASAFVNGIVPQVSQSQDTKANDLLARAEQASKNTQDSNK